jgi:hypothetical protein
MVRHFHGEPASASSVNKIGELREACTHTPPNSTGMSAIYTSKSHHGLRATEPALPKATWSSASPRSLTVRRVAVISNNVEATTRTAPCVYSKPGVFTTSRTMRDNKGRIIARPQQIDLHHQQPTGEPMAGTCGVPSAKDPSGVFSRSGKVSEYPVGRLLETILLAKKRSHADRPVLHHLMT